MYLKIAPRDTPAAVKLVGRKRDAVDTEGHWMTIGIGANIVAWKAAHAFRKAIEKAHSAIVAAVIVDLARRPDEPAGPWGGRIVVITSVANDRRQFNARIFDHPTRQRTRIACFVLLIRTSTTTNQEGEGGDVHQKHHAPAYRRARIEAPSTKKRGALGPLFACPRELSRASKWRLLELLASTRNGLKNRFSPLPVRFNSFNLQ